MLHFGRSKRQREAEAPEPEETVTDLSVRTSMQFVSSALDSVERLAREQGTAEEHGTFLDAPGRSVITAELLRCIGRARFETHAELTRVTLTDVFDVAELAVRILVSLPLKNRVACALVCRAWAARVHQDCEDEDRHDSKTLRCVLLDNLNSPVVQLSLFSRSSKAFVLVRAAPNEHRTKSRTCPEA